MSKYMNVTKNPYLAKRLKRLEFPVIIKFNDHHQEFMHYAEDAEEMGKIFLHVLDNRMDSYFYLDEDAKLFDDGDEDILTIEQIQKLPKQYREDAMKKFNEREEDHSEASQNNKVYEKAKKALKIKDGALAWECLEAHIQYNDEEYEFIPIKGLRV